jgi:hypothetical protein
MIRRLLLVLAAAYTLPFVTAAHAAEADAQLWLASTATVDLGGNTSFFGDLGARFSDDRGGLYTDYARGAFAYELSDSVSLAAGFVHVEIRGGGRRTGTEERPFEQLIVDLGSGFSSRTRLEQRFFSSTDDTGWRLRERIGWTHELGNNLDLLLGSEAFFALDSAGGEGGFRRLRSAALIAMPVNDALDVRLGYINQWTRRPGGDEVAHAASLTLAAHF